MGIVVADGSMRCSTAIIVMSAVKCSLFLISFRVRCPFCFCPLRNRKKTKRKRERERERGKAEARLLANERAVLLEATTS